MFINLQVIYHSQSMNEPAHITKLISQLHKNTGEVLKSKPRLVTFSVLQDSYSLYYMLRIASSRGLGVRAFA